MQPSPTFQVENCSLRKNVNVIYVPAQIKSIRRIIMEVNPNHPVTQLMNDQWHKVAALLMCSFGITEFKITPEVIKKLPQGMAIAANSKPDALYIQLVDEKTAEKLAKQAGGMPL
jgi:hypothetical protein